MAPAPIGALLVGLGNPGPEYSGNRHNLGFMVIDALAARAGLRFSIGPLFAAAAGTLAGRTVLLLKPQTFINRSGRAVAAALDELNVDGLALTAEACLVIHDELDLPVGTLRLKRSGGHGGHNGLRSIIGAIGPDFARLRIGIDHPGPGADVSDYVLSDVPDAQRAAIGDQIVRAIDAVERVLARGLDAVMSEINFKD